MSCPRCPTELRKKEMLGHLWDKHRLVLDGQRVREPWRVIEDWVVEYGLEKDPQVLQRCRELALRDDPQTGLPKLQRLLYRRGLRDRELLIELRSLVKMRKATLCPHCCAAVSVDGPPVVQPLSLEAARLQGYGYDLEISERGMIPSLRIESPDAILFRGREPGRLLTRIGGMALLTGPLMLGTYYLVEWGSPRDIPGVLAAAAALGIGLVGAGLLYLIWPAPRPAKDRLVRAAWKLLVPEILQEKMGRREWGFLHGLVELSAEVRTQKLNHDHLLECCEEASEAAPADALALACLASLSRRYLADMRERGEGVDDFVLTLAAECFKGKLPLSHLSDLLANYHGKERLAWSRCDLNRLPILIADRAFAEMDIDDWLNLGRAFPVLHAVLNLEHRWHWLQFHALWQQRQGKPWQSAGEAIDMIDLRNSPATSRSCCLTIRMCCSISPGPTWWSAPKGSGLKGCASRVLPPTPT